VQLGAATPLLRSSITRFLLWYQKIFWLAFGWSKQVFVRGKRNPRLIVDAFRAGMTYINGLEGGPGPKHSSNLH
jgi:hypothetical protein